MTGEHLVALVTDPSLPPDIYTGPYAFLAGIFGFAFYGVREWRKAREIDVAGAEARADAEKSKALKAEAQKDAIELRANRDLETLRSEIRDLRTSTDADALKAHATIHQLRLKLTDLGVPPEEIP